MKNNLGSPFHPAAPNDGQDQNFPQQYSFPDEQALQTQTMMPPHQQYPIQQGFQPQGQLSHQPNFQHEPIYQQQPAGMLPQPQYQQSMPQPQYNAFAQYPADHLLQAQTAMSFNPDFTPMNNAQVQPNLQMSQHHVNPVSNYGPNNTFAPSGRASSKQSAPNNLAPSYSHAAPNAQSKPPVSQVFQGARIAGNNRIGITPFLHVDSLPKAQEVLKQFDLVSDMETIFDNLEDASAWRAGLRDTDASADSDQTIPRSPEAKKALVKVLFKAFKSTEKAKDNANMVKAFEQQKHNNAHVEVVCWEVLMKLIDRVEKGPGLVEYDAERVRENHHLKTFADRFDAVVESFLNQKTICKHLLDAPFMVRLLDDPISSQSRVESNRKLNKRKGDYMSQGKKVLNGPKPETRQAKKSATIQAAGDNVVDHSPTASEFDGAPGLPLPPTLPLTANNLDSSSPQSLNTMGSRPRSSQAYSDQRRNVQTGSGDNTSPAPGLSYHDYTAQHLAPNAHFQSPHQHNMAAPNFGPDVLPYQPEFTTAGNQLQNPAYSDPTNVSTSCPLIAYLKANSLTV